VDLLGEHDFTERHQCITRNARFDNPKELQGHNILKHIIAKEMYLLLLEYRTKD
jgi:hypothetical protein